MESQVQQETKAAVSTEPPGAMVAPSKPPSTDEQPLQEWIGLAVDFLSKLTDEIGKFFSDYQKPLLNLSLILSGVVTVYIILAVLDAINDIPLLAPLLQLVGLGYSGWFVFRYLLRSSTRKELLAEFDSLKSQVVGQNSQES